MDEMKQAQQELNRTVVFRGISADLHSGLRKLIIDSAASGMPFEIVKDNCKKLWNQELEEGYYKEIIKQSTKEISKRRVEIETEIEKMGFISIANNVIVELRERSKIADTTKEYVALLATLKEYLNFFISKKEERSQPIMHIETVNVQQNNYLFLKALQEEKIIEVVDTARFKRIFGDGENGTDKPSGES